MKPIYTNKGSRNQPIDRHYWHKEDSQELKEFRTTEFKENFSTQEKRDFSKIQGELFGHLYTTEQLGYQTEFDGDSKSISQGFDAIYSDDESLVVVEFKGQNSPESKSQKKADWTPETCEKILNLKPPYSQVSEYERGWAETILETYEKGESLRYEVIRTEVDEKTGEFWTQLEKQTILEKPNESGDEQKKKEEKTELEKTTNEIQTDTKVEHLDSIYQKTVANIEDLNTSESFNDSYETQEEDSFNSSSESQNG